jgi:hypothetical protein
MWKSTVTHTMCDPCQHAVCVCVCVCVCPHEENPPKLASGKHTALAHPLHMSANSCVTHRSCRTGAVTQGFVLLLRCRCGRAFVLPSKGEATIWQGERAPGSYLPAAAPSCKLMSHMLGSLSPCCICMHEQLCVSFQINDVSPK